VRALAGLVARRPISCFFVFFVVFPYLVPYKALATQVLIYGLFALGFNLLYGYTGLLSFGHAAFFGLGAYGTGVTLARLGVTSVWTGLAVGLVLAAGGGAVIGHMCLRRRGIYFAMLSLAFAQLLYFIGFHLSWLTGGDDGLRGIPTLPVGLPGLRVSIESPVAFYYFVLVIVGGAVAALKRILDSPFGAVLQAIRENSDRATACGFDVTRVKLLSFVFSGAFAGLAGGLNALYLGVVPIDTLYWTTSGQVVMMTLLGGAGTFFGPFVGAGVFLVLEDVLSVFTESWQLVIGAVFVGFVLFLPRGIWGTVVDRLVTRGAGAGAQGTAHDPAEQPADVPRAQHRELLRQAPPAPRHNGGDRP
jgi:branched-chain amino acid transport system permease protein